MQSLAIPESHAWHVFELLKTLLMMRCINVANKKILLGPSFIYLVASLNAARHGWAAKKTLRFRRSKTAYVGYKIAKIMN